MRLPSSKEFFRVLATATVVALSAVGLTACGTQNTPEMVFAEYIAALDAGDPQKALSLVKNTNGIKASSVATLKDIKLGKVELAGSADGTDAYDDSDSDDDSDDYSTDAQEYQEFVVSGSPVDVAFSMVNGQWRLAEPKFIEELPVSEYPLAAFAKSKTVLNTAKGDSLDLAKTKYLVTPTGESTAKLSAKIDNLWFEPNPVELTLGHSSDDDQVVAKVTSTVKLKQSSFNTLAEPAQLKKFSTTTDNSYSTFVSGTLNTPAACTHSLTSSDDSYLDDDSDSTSEVFTGDTLDYADLELLATGTTMINCDGTAVVAYEGEANRSTDSATYTYKLTDKVATPSAVVDNGY